MVSSAPEDVEYAVARLKKLLKPEDGAKSPQAGVIFLLGAGCSRQYGLPSFQELLAAIYEDCYERLPDPAWSFEILRSKLDGHWQALGPEERKTLLCRFLQNIRGGQCPAYRRLARVCKAAKERVRIIVNMNFDLLLEEALQAEEVPYVVTTRFPSSRSNRKLWIVKPHGSIGDLGPWPKPSRNGPRSTGRIAPRKERNELILDIASSELFAIGDEQKNEQKRAQGHFTSNHVVSLGYSGVDAKIASALSDFPTDLAASERKLFFIEPRRPDPRLFSAIARRTSQSLVVSGEDGSFESFLESLYPYAESSPADHPAEETPHPARCRIAEARTLVAVPSFPELTYMSGTERIALAQCLRLAQSIRAAINVADRSEKSIEEHGHDLYRLCLQLAAGSRLCLTPPERYVLYAAAFLHDLGYFAAYSDGTAIEHGWVLLTGEHGRKTAELILQRLKDERDLAKRLVPYRYLDEADAAKNEDNVGAILGALLFICRAHSAYDQEHVVASLKGRRESSWELPSLDAKLKVHTAGSGIELRTDLLQALFVTAEELVKSHPFLPSVDSVVAQDESRYAIEDPVLDFYLRQRPDEITFKVEGGRILVQSRGHFPRAEKFLLTMTNRGLARYNELLVAANERHREIELCFGAGATSHERPDDLLREAFTEILSGTLDTARSAAESGLKEYVGVVMSEIENLAASTAGIDEEHLWAARRFAAGFELPMTWFLETGNCLESMVERSKAGSTADLVADLRLEFALIRRTCERAWSIGGLGDVTALRKAAEDLTRCLEGTSGEEMSRAVDLLAAFHRAFVAARTFWLDAKVAESRRLLTLLQAAAASGDGSPLTGMIERLETSLSSCSTGEVTSILDVASIYALPLQREGSPDAEPRVDLTDPIIRHGLRRIPCLESVHDEGLSRELDLPNHGLLPIYLPLAIDRRRTPRAPIGQAMEDLFCKSFEEVVYPAWRFLARKWHDGIEPVNMARACLDLGSSRFRAEVVGGIRSLLRQVEWSPDGAHAHLHQGCTLCTSRLLYICSYARRLFPAAELGVFQRGDDRGIDATAAGILQYFCSRQPKAETWWGIPGDGERDEPGSSIHSAEYLSWSARAVAFCHAVSAEVEQHTGRRWLEEIWEQERCKKLLGERWAQVFDAGVDEILNPQSEEPHSFVVGHVALAYRELRLLREQRKVEVPPGDEAAFKGNIMAAYDRFLAASPGGPGEKPAKHSLLSRLFLWPASILAVELLGEDPAPDQQSLERRRHEMEEMVDLCHDCVESRVWVPRETAGRGASSRRDERDVGSWGSTVKDTHTIVTSLATFWRHAFDSQYFHEYRGIFKEKAEARSARRPR
jgi:hypothetical protein